MSPGKITLLVILSVIAAVSLFFGVKAVVSVTKNPSRPVPTPSGSTPVTNSSVDPRIGQVAYANTGGVVVTDAAFNIYKIAAKDEWVGTVYSIGDTTYEVSGNRFVNQSDVYLVSL